MVIKTPRICIKVRRSFRKTKDNKVVTSGAVAATGATIEVSDPFTPKL